MNLKLERTGTVLLAFATITVGVAILAGGSTGRALNGLSGICWFASAGLLVSAASRSSRQPTRWLIILGLTAVVAFVIRPSDLVLATVGFGGAGLLIGIIARDRELLWVKLVPALYLPFHIGTAVLKAVVRSMTGTEASIRSEPPPTAAIVPLVMLGAALVGGYVAVSLKSRLHRSQSGDRHLPRHV